MANYYMTTLLESLIIVMPIAVWAGILALIIVLTFFVGRATSLPWLIKYHVRHIKDSEVIRLTSENKMLSSSKKLVETKLKIAENKLSHISTTVNARSV